jgi:hypothetical protein
MAETVDAAHSWAASGQTFCAPMQAVIPSRLFPHSECDRPVVDRHMESLSAFKRQALCAGARALSRWDSRGRLDQKPRSAPVFVIFPEHIIKPPMSRPREDEITTERSLGCAKRFQPSTSAATSVPCVSRESRIACPQTMHRAASSARRSAMVKVLQVMCLSNHGHIIKVLFTGGRE